MSTEQLLMSLREDVTRNLPGREGAPGRRGEAPGIEREPWARAETPVLESGQAPSLNGGPEPLQTG